MQSPLSNDKSIGMVPYVENPQLYKDYFNFPQPRSKASLTILQNDKLDDNEQRGVESYKGQNREEVSEGQYTTQIGNGEVQLVSTSQAAVDRAKEGLKRDNKRKKILKNNHSLLGWGKGKSKSKGGKKTGKKTGKKSTSGSKKKVQSKKGKKGAKKKSKTSRKKVGGKKGKKVKK